MKSTILIPSAQASDPEVLAEATRLFESGAQEQLTNINEHFYNIAIKFCESPIEQLMLAALAWRRYGYLERMPDIYHPRSGKRLEKSEVSILPQHEIAKYRVDFAIIARFIADKDIKVVVECDGHEFHEKTKQQAARDNRRDRELQSLGWAVLRFTGSEIWEDAQGCAEEVSNFVMMCADEEWRRQREWL